MQMLKDKILAEGKVKDGQVLKVDRFLNHQIDIAFLNEIGKEFKRIYARDEITKILTIESSGIGIACITAQYFHVPVVFAKKSQTSNISGDVYTEKVQSFTHNRLFDIIVSKDFLKPEDSVLIIDDFLAMGSALCGLINLVKSAGATLVGAGIVIEKGFQGGGKRIRDMGVRVESLAIVDAMKEDGTLIFRD